MTPEDYVGKSVRMNGMYVSFYEEENDFRYFACIVHQMTPIIRSNNPLFLVW